MGKDAIAFAITSHRNQYLAYHLRPSLEQAVDEAVLVDAYGFCRWYPWQAWHGHDLSTDHHDETGAG